MVGDLEASLYIYMCVCVREREREREGERIQMAKANSHRHRRHRYRQVPLRFAVVRGHAGRVRSSRDSQGHEHSSPGLRSPGGPEKVCYR